MTNEHNLKQLNLSKQELDIAIDDLESHLKELKSKRKSINGQIFQLMNSKFSVPIYNTPPKPIQNRKNN